MFTGNRSIGVDVSDLQVRALLLDCSKFSDKPDELESLNLKNP